MWGWLADDPKVVVIRPSVKVYGHAKEVGSSAQADHWWPLKVPESSCAVFLLVAGLRPVKDPLFLLDTFSKWHANLLCASSSAGFREDTIPIPYLMVIGPILDSSYAEIFLSRVQSLPGIL